MMRWLLLVLLACIAVWPASAQDARIETRLAKEQTFLVGQRVTIDVTLLTTTSFSGAPAFDLPSLPGALLMQVQDRPLLGSETVQGTSFVSQAWQLALFPQQAGKLTLPPFTVRFTSAGADGGPAQDHRLQTQLLTIDVAAPKGASGVGPFIVGQGVTLTERWQPDVHDLRPGDAVTRTITLKAEDVPAMLLPSLEPGTVKGLRSYARPPEVSDHQERGTFTGTRIERTVYVAETPGSTSIPAIALGWWDASNGRRHMTRLPSRSFRVAADAAPSTPAGPAAQEVPPDAGIGRYAMMLAGGALAIGGLLWIALRQRFSRKDDESEAFAAMRAALRSGDARQAQSAAFRWLDCLPGLPRPARLEGLGARLGQPELDPELERLLRAASVGGSWQPSRSLRDGLNRLRRSCRSSPARHRRGDLQPLNPS